MNDSSFPLAILVEGTAYFGQELIMNRKVSFDCVSGWWQGLSDLQKSAFADDPSKVSAYLDVRVKEIAETTFVTHVSDQDAIQLLIQWKGRTPEQAEVIVKAWRKYALHVGYDGPVVWKIKDGFTLKTTAPLAGPCYDRLGYLLQSWNFADNPTADSMVFWVPRLVEQSTSKTITQMEAHRTEQRRVHNLPEYHCTSFGSVQLLFALILAHFKRTGERVPLNAFYAVSDTLDAVGRRLVAGDFRSRGLFCGYWLGSISDGYVGFFLLGVEELGQPAGKAGE